MVPEYLSMAPWLPAVRIGGRQVQPTRLGQSRAMTPEEQEAERLLDEARSQLRNVLQNFPALVVSMGQDGAREALEQANLSVELYEEQLRNARALA